MISERSELIRPVFSDQSGAVHAVDQLCALGRSGSEVWELAPDDLIPLPEGSDLFYAAGRVPIGLNPETGELQEILPLNTRDRAFPVAAILPAGYTRLFLPAWETNDGPDLPLFGYAAVASRNGQLLVAARQTDDTYRWNPLHYNSPDLGKMVSNLESRLPANRIVKQLGRCAIEYHCLTAQNLFYSRWEAGLPTSPSCNAGCIGCISLQESSCCPAPQSRIEFVPSVDEIAEVAVHHLEHAEDPIISFGQGCEGEPLLRGCDLVCAVSTIRGRTSRGTVNVNTNASRPDVVRQLANSGLDSIRVTLLSAREDSYNKYHRPVDYSLSSVLASISSAGELGVFVSLNLLVMPGFTDQEPEVKALFKLLDELPVHMIQLRNLNIDPDLFFERMGWPREGGIGIGALINEISQRYPKLRIGSYSPAVRRGTAM